MSSEKHKRIGIIGGGSARVSIAAKQELINSLNHMAEKAKEQLNMEKKSKDILPDDERLTHEETQAAKAQIADAASEATKDVLSQFTPPFESGGTEEFVVIDAKGNIFCTLEDMGGSLTMAEMIADALNEKFVVKPLAALEAEREKMKRMVVECQEKYRKAREQKREHKDENAVYYYNGAVDCTHLIIEAIDSLTKTDNP